MSENETADRFDRYTRTLILEGPAKARLYASPILPEEKSLFETIDLLWENMQEVAPAAEFETSLRVQLLDEARREQNKAQLGFQNEHRRSRKPLIASAAVVGAAATLAGAFAYWRWNTSRHAV